MSDRARNFSKRSVAHGLAHVAADVVLAVPLGAFEGVHAHQPKARPADVDRVPHLRRRPAPFMFQQERGRAVGPEAGVSAFAWLQEYKYKLQQTKGCNLMHDVFVDRNGG